MFEIEFKIFYLLWSLVMSFCFAYFFYKKDKKIKKSIFISIGIFCLTFSVGALYSFIKLNKINMMIENESFIIKKGNVKSLEQFNGMDTFTIGNTKFELDHDSIHCVDVKDILEENTFLTIKYVEISLIGNSKNKCVVEIN